MPWFLVDDQYPTDDRILATSLAARGLWVMAGAWASAHHTDVVPAHVLASLGSTPQLTAELVTARVWRKAKNGYRFEQRGLCKIPVQETVDKQREMKTDRQRRWREGQRRRNVDASTAPSTWDPSPTPIPMAGVPTDGARASPRPVENPKTHSSKLNGAATRLPPPMTEVLADLAAKDAAASTPRGRHAKENP